MTRSFWVQGNNIWVHPSTVSPRYPPAISHTIWDQNPPHTGTEVVSEMSTHYGMVNWYSHGNLTFFGVKAAPYGGVWGGDNYCLEAGYCSDEEGDGAEVES